MSSARKKVLVRRFTGPILPGYLPLSGFVQHHQLHRPPTECTIDLLDLSGRVLQLPLDDIKHISYVRDFNLADTLNPERLIRRSFLARPRTEGLWLRMTFRSGDLLEGLAPTDISLLEDVLNDAGLHLTPPDIRSNTQRLYIPRTSLTHLQLIAVITSPSRRKPLPSSTDSTLQKDLFDTLIPPNTRLN